jgi:hypothetical protein
MLNYSGSDAKAHTFARIYILVTVSQFRVEGQSWAFLKPLHPDNDA